MGRSPLLCFSCQKSPSCCARPRNMPKQETQVRDQQCWLAAGWPLWRPATIGQTFNCCCTRHLWGKPAQGKSTLLQLQGMLRGLWGRGTNPATAIQAHTDSATRLKILKKFQLKNASNKRSKRNCFHLHKQQNTINLQSKTTSPMLAAKSTFLK